MPESKFVDDNKVSKRLHYIVAREAGGKKVLLGMYQFLLSRPSTSDQ
jgi:hypothetical protein